jgi:hypothetical protein
MEVRSNSKLSETFDKIQTLYNTGVRKNIFDKKPSKLKKLSLPLFVKRCAEEEDANILYIRLLMSNPKKVLFEVYDIY